MNIKDRMIMEDYHKQIGDLQEMLEKNWELAKKTLGGMDFDNLVFRKQA